MKYKVISLFCIGRQRSFKKNDIVSASDFVDAEAKVKGGFLVAVGDDEALTIPAAKEVGEAPRTTDAGAETFITPAKEIAPTEVAPEVEVKASIKEVDDSPSDELRIKPAPNKGKKEFKNI